MRDALRIRYITGTVGCTEAGANDESEGDGMTVPVPTRLSRVKAHPRKRIRSKAPKLDSM